MSISKILKPKSPKQILKDFSSRHHISEFEMQDFMKDFRRDKRINVLIFSFFLWSFGLSMIINSILALQEKYFWFPIKAEHSMFSFINIFWAASWIAAGVFIIIYGIIVIVKAYTE